MCLDCSSLQSRVSALISYDVFNDDPYELECDNLQIDEETMRSNLSLEQIQGIFEKLMRFALSETILIFLSYIKILTDIPY